jgi:hypothetical protein
VAARGGCQWVLAHAAVEIGHSAKRTTGINETDGRQLWPSDIAGRRFQACVSSVEHPGRVF